MATIQQVVQTIEKLVSSEGQCPIEIPWPSKRRLIANIIERSYPSSEWTPLADDPDGIKYVEVAFMVDQAIEQKFSYLNVLVDMGIANCKLQLAKIKELVDQVPSMVADLTLAAGGSMIPSTPPAPNIAGMAAASTNQKSILTIIGNALEKLGRLLWDLVYTGLDEIPDAIIALLESLNTVKKTVSAVSLPIPG